MYENQQVLELELQGCPLKEKCTPSANRRVTRWEHQDVLEKMQARLEQNPDAMRIRRCIVEHPYGTIKAWMRATHFLTKGLEHVKAEMSLHVLAYNIKRLMAILGIADMMKAIRAFILLRCLKTAMQAICKPVMTSLLKKNIAPRSAPGSSRPCSSFADSPAGKIFVFTHPGSDPACRGSRRFP